MTDDADFDLDELDKLREQTKNIQLFASDKHYPKTEMNEVQEEDGDAEEISRGDNHTPSKKSATSESSSKLHTVKAPPIPSNIKKGPEPSEGPTPPRLPPKLIENRKVVQRPPPAHPPLSQSVKGIPGPNQKPKPLQPEQSKEVKHKVEHQVYDSKALFEEPNLHQAESQNTVELPKSPDSIVRSEKVAPAMTSGWVDDVGKLVEINAGLREDLEDKRDKLKAYMSRLQAMEERLKAKDEVVRKVEDQARNEFLEEKRKLQQVYREKELALEAKIDQRMNEVEMGASISVENAVQVMRESTGILQVEIERHRDHNERISTLIGSLEHIVSDHKEIEDKMQESFERIFESLSSKEVRSKAHSFKAIEDKIARARLEVQRDYPVTHYDPDVQRIFDESSKQPSIRRYPVERPILTDSPINHEEGINLYTESSKTTRTARGGTEGSVRSSKGLTHSKTAEKGKFIIASDLPMMKQEVPKKPDLGSQPISYPTEDIPDNISVSSRKSKRVLFNKKPSSRSGKAESEYGMSDQRQDDYRSPGADRKIWENTKQQEDYSDLNSQTDTANVSLLHARNRRLEILTS
jgi:hypothetical protein